MKKKIDCTVIGDAMIDVVLPLSGIKDLHHLSQGGVTNTKVRISPGGAANVAFYISRLGGTSAFIGKVGNDYFGKIFIDDLKKNGIIQNISKCKTKNTGIVFDLVFPNGERFFIVDRGANTELEYKDISCNLIRNSKFLYFTGFSFQDEKPSENIVKAIKKVYQNVTIVFNPGAPNLAKKFREKFVRFTKKYVNILILNEAEGQHLTGYTLEKEVIKFLLPLAKVVILTRGAKGSIIATKKEIFNISALPTKVVDTTGAGDAYAGGLIYGLSKKMELRKAGEFASRVAEKIVSMLGTRLDSSNLSLKDFCLHKLKE